MQSQKRSGMIVGTTALSFFAAAQNLVPSRDRPFAAAQGDKRGAAFNIYIKF